MADDLASTVVVLAPSENDSLVATAVLRESGFKAIVAENLAALCSRIETPVGAIILADESLFGDDLERLQGILSRQDSWSDLPIILIGSRTGMKASEFFSTSGNISLLERPFSRTALVRAVDVALRARKKQYQVKELLEQQVRATRTRDEFFATLSHELRTPLSIMLGWIEIMRSDTCDPATTASALEILERNARVQKSLIDDLLDMSRIITGKMRFDFVHLDFGALLKTIVAGFQPEADAKSVALSISLPDMAFSIEGDAQRLMQAISNLISNAVKFTSSGGKVKVALVERDGAYQLQVEDNGKGIDPQFLPSIFDRLKQEDMSSTRSHGGLGLGLAIAYHIIEAHRGTLSAFSEGRGKGTRMTLTIPKSNILSVRTPSIDPAPMARSLRGTRVLVVDDSPDILALLEILLGQVEAEVRSVESATQALEELEKFKPDVLVSDIGMPNIDGYQLIKTIRARSAERGGQTPAVALTAYARDEERLKAIQSGFQMHISKPISNKELISAITVLTSSKSMPKQKALLQTSHLSTLH